jgi:hypothetical protein
MKLGDIARVSRGIATGDSSVYIMTREQAKDRGLERFVRPVITSAREVPRTGDPVIRDNAGRHVVLIASRHDVDEYAVLSEYLGDRIPRIATVHPSPIAATYVGVPHFVANPDGLIVTNSLYCVRPRQSLSEAEVIELVGRLNTVAANLPRMAGIRYSPRALEAMDT